MSWSMLPALVKRAALDALALLSPVPSRDELMSAIAEEKSSPQALRRAASQWMTTAESGNDEEWWQQSHCLEISYEHGELVLQSYWNTATMVGASQKPQFRISSTGAFDVATGEQLQQWLTLWRKFVAIGKPQVWVSY